MTNRLAIADAYREITVQANRERDFRKAEIADLVRAEANLVVAEFRVEMTRRVASFRRRVTAVVTDIQDIYEADADVSGELKPLDEDAIRDLVRARIAFVRTGLAPEEAE